MASDRELRRAVVSSLLGAIRRGEAGSRPETLCVPHVTGNGRLFDRVALELLERNGISRSEVLYVGPQTVIEDVGTELGVPTMPSARLPKADLSPYKAVFLGEMYPGVAERAERFIAENFTGLVLKSVPAVPAMAKQARITDGDVVDTTMDEVVEAPGPR